MSTKKEATSKNKNDTFLNIPKSWMYLIGYEYQAINRQGEPALTKGKKPVMKRIDHADLLLLDEIRGFSERGNKECFEEAVALARAVGMIGQEKKLCDKILQLCGLGFVKARMEFKDGQTLPKVILQADTQLIYDAAEACKESVLEAQRIHSQEADISTLLREKNILQEYLRKYLQEHLQENLPEYLPEDIQEDIQAPQPLIALSSAEPTKELPPTQNNTKGTTPDTASEDFYSLDGKTNNEISRECRTRVDTLRQELRSTRYELDWYEFLDNVAFKNKKQNSRIKKDIDDVVYLVGALDQPDSEIDRMVQIINYLLEQARSDTQLRENLERRKLGWQLKPLVKASVPTAQEGGQPIDKEKV